MSFKAATEKVHWIEVWKSCFIGKGTIKYNRTLSIPLIIFHNWHDSIIDMTPNSKNIVGISHVNYEK